MFIGHFGVALALKRADKTLSLGLLFIAVQFSDLVYGFALLAGIEKVSFIAGTNPNTSVQYLFFPYSHSLVATLLWAGLFALIFLIAPIKSNLHKRRTAGIMAIAVLSHFVLDVIVHNADVDLLGNGVYKIGLGLWNYPLASYGIEALLLIVGLWIYLRATKAISLIGKYGLPILVAILLVLGAMSTFIMQTTDMVNFALTMLVIYFSMITLAFWLDRKRQ